MFKPRGLTLVEVIISTIILAITLAGMANLFISGKRWLMHSRSRVAGGEIGKLFLDPLSMQVQESDWDLGTNDLRAPRSWVGAPVTVNQKLYTPTYTVSRVFNGPVDTGLRRVEVTVSWPEVNPANQ